MQRLSGNRFNGSFQSEVCPNCEGRGRIERLERLSAPSHKDQFQTAHLAMVVENLSQIRVNPAMDKAVLTKPRG